MPLIGITAATVPGARQIRLAWSYPPGGADGVRVMRANGSHPASPSDGTLVADGLAITEAVDQELRDGVVYYYGLFPFSGSPRVFQIDRRNRAAALASGPSGVADRMFALLPRIYHRYDTFLLASPGAPEDADKGQLRRFLDLPGGQLDLFASALRALQDAHDPAHVDGRLLPALAAWLGWPTDFTLDFAAQRRDLRVSTALYQTIGIVPTAEATVKRLVGSESRSKEMVHNVLTSNRPERLNLWQKTRDAGGVWSSGDTPISLDSAFDGRPALAQTADGTFWLFYQVVEDSRSTIWLKQRPTAPGSVFGPSRPLVYRDSGDRDPTAAVQGDRLWVVWSVYDRAAGSWSLEGRILQGGGVSLAPLPASSAAERRRPSAIVDPAGGVWLFWMERSSPMARWTVTYSRHDGTNWSPAVTNFGAGVHVDEDLYAFFEASSGSIKLYWSRREPVAALSGVLRWRIFSRTKAGLDPNTSDWGAEASVADAAPSDHDDREPFAFATAAGTEVLFSSNRGGTFGIWSLAPGGGVTPAAGTLFSERAPLAFVDGANVTVIHRSNRGVSYQSDLYRATQTVDLRYAGCTTASTRDTAKLGLRRSFDDFQTYSYDTGPSGVRRNGDWYARDTVSLYVTPPGPGAPEVLAGLRRLSQGLRAFMPATTRVVLTPSADLNTETVIPGVDTAGLP